MPRLESLAVVKGEHVCTNEDIIRNAAYSWSPMTADDIEDKTGIRERRYTERRLEHISLQAAHAALAGAGRRPEEIGAVIFCSCTSTRLIPSVATWLSGQLGIFQTHGSFDLIAACAGFPYGLAEAVRLLQEVKRPVLVVCAEKFSDKIGSVRPSRMIFGDGASALVVGPAADGASPDIEVVQAYASGPVSQVNSIIWPNPEFDNNLTVYGPEVKALVERYLDQMMGELRALDAPDGGSLLDAIDIVVPHQANKSMVAKSATAAGLDGDAPLLRRRDGRQRLRRQHPDRDPRRRPRGRDRPPDARVHAGVRRRRGGRLHGDPRRPRHRRSRAGRGGRAADRSGGERGPRWRTSAPRSEAEDDGRSHTHWGSFEEVSAAPRLVGAARHGGGRQAACSAWRRVAMAWATAARVAWVSLSGLSIMKSCVMPS